MDKSSKRIERHVIGYIGDCPIFAIAGGAPTDLEQLLKTVEAIDPSKRTAEEQAPSDEELTTARSELVAALKAAVSGDRPDNEAGKAIREAIDRIDAEKVTRTEQLESDRAEAAKLLEGLEASDPNADPENDPEDPNADPDADPEKDNKDPENKKEPVTVAASLDLAASIKRSTARTEATKEAEKAQADVVVASLGPAQGYGLSQDATIDDVAEVFNRFAPQVKRGGSVLVHLDRIYPEDRSLGNSSAENTRTIDAVTGPRAITAAGGICEPLPADFSHPICGDRGRPIFNANPVFRADRGGIRFGPSVTLGDLTDAITVWTAATDETPGSDTKACPRVDCEDELTATVDAIVACLTVGNFQARFNPEFWRSRLDLLMVEHDRVAEQTLYATIETGSTQVSFTGTTGTTIDVLEAIDRAVAGINSRHRLINTGYRAILPSWLRDAIRAQLVGQMPAGSTDLFAVADAQINQFFSSRRVNPVWSPDIEVFGAQAAAALVDWPGGDVDVVIYPEGTWLTLDGGTLDLGTQIVDSTLNATNDRQAFMETFEGVVKRGCESLSIDVTLDEGCICAGVIS